MCIRDRPGTIAYAAACAKEILGDIPEYMEIWVSGNILKNVKSVIIPNTGNLKGVAEAAFCGIVGGNPKRKLEVLNTLTANDADTVRKLVREESTYSIHPVSYTHLDVYKRQVRGYMTMRSPVSWEVLRMGIW